MATFSAMRSRIADDLDDSTVDTQIGVAINRAIDHYQSERFWFTEAIATFATVADQDSYGTGDGIPSDINKIDTLQVTVNNDFIRLFEKTYDWMKLVDSGRISGRPTFWTWYEDKIFLYPTPDDAYTITVSYTKNYVDLSADGDTNDFTDNAEDLIEARAEYWMYTRVVKDFEAAKFAKQEEVEALTALRSITSKRVATGRLQASGIAGIGYGYYAY